MTPERPDHRTVVVGALYRRSPLLSGTTDLALAPSARRSSTAAGVVPGRASMAITGAIECTLDVLPGYGQDEPETRSRAHFDEGPWRILSALMSAGWTL